MILVDTSVWVDHLRAKDQTFAERLEAGQVLIHPFIIGELALGALRDRDAVISSLRDLPRSQTATEEEMLLFIDSHGLAGTGIGYIDAHLLASVHLTPRTSLWTRDTRLDQVAERLGINASFLQ